MRDFQRRVLSLTAGVTLMIGVGSIYAISAWNAQLKALLHFSQAGISTVSSLAMLGSYLSFFPGILFDRIGPRRSLLLACVGLMGLYGFLHLAITTFPAHISAFSVGMCLLFVGQFSAFCIFASIVTNEGIFGDHNRGKVMAMLTSAYSCGGAVFAYTFNHAFRDDVAAFYLFEGFFLLLMTLFGCVAFYRSTDAMQRNSEEVIDGNVSVPLPETSDEKATLLHVDVTGFEMLRDPRFALLFVPVLIIIGAGLFVMSNVSFITESLGGPMEQVPTMVALFSIGNTVARLATGALSDKYLDRYPRGVWLIVSVFLTVLTQLFFLWLPPAWLVMPVTLAGLAEGVMFGSFPVIMREAFGLKHYGKNYGLISIANCIGYPLFFSPLSSYFYQHATGSRTVDGVQKCFGTECFRPMFLLIIVLCAIPLACSMKLLSRQMRARSQYRVLP
ncbi:hypothetical protein PINS_up009101 [Pythium insidiosum]|nr:hypothetical protein PINS_up009101 [Pythium insidiosum]